VALGILVLLLLALCGGSYGYARLSLPQVSGQLKAPGLQATVTVYRDEWGVPHIEAQNSHDLFFTQGYVTAQDRLWEMDLTRRAASGRLSEVMGAGLVSTDKFFRTLMLRQAAEKSVPAYSPDARAALEDYAQGVNAYIQAAGGFGKLPVEFKILGYTPEPWTSVDSAVIGKYMAYDLGGNMSGEVYRYLLRQKVGDVLATQLWPAYPKDGVTIIHSAAAATTAPQAAMLPPDDTHIDLSGLLSAAVFPDQFVGSNNWVVSGALTKSGKPLLANDPHLGIRTPAIWYQTHLILNGDREKMNVIGVMFPGAPGVVIGHNEKVAWGVTNTGPDVQDLYLERRNPDNPYQFLYQDKWEDAKVIKDPIRVKGAGNIPFEVVVTRHGPIVSEVTGPEKERPKDALALRWTAHLATTELEAVLAFDKAQNWAEFRKALQLFNVPTQNFVFAAADGTIAYHAGGLVPIRAHGDGLVPVPGWTDTYEWKDYIPFDKMPEVVNPKDGYIATANNKVVADDYPYFLTAAWAQPYRATRITEVLKSKTGFTVDDMQRLQADYTNLQARTLLPILLPPVGKASLSDAEKAAFGLLQNWDFADAADQAAPLVYQLWWRNLTKQLYQPKMGDDLYGLMADTGNVTDMIIRNAAQGQANDWVAAAGGLEQLAVRSFQAAVAEGQKLQGNDLAKWSWGEYHRMGPAHPLGSAAKPLAWVFNPKTYPIGGSSVTVGAMSYNAKTGLVSSAAPWRQVVDMSDIDNSRDIVTPGQSGHFLSEWYSSQELMHRNGELHPQVFNSAAYRKGTRLELQP
jgi:penicillin amidase